LIRIAQLSEHDTILDKHVCRVEKKKIPTIWTSRVIASSRLNKNYIDKPTGFSPGQLQYCSWLFPGTITRLVRIEIIFFLSTLPEVGAFKLFQGPKLTRVNSLPGAMQNTLPKPI
jgi:hypothetical protein